VLNLPDLAKFPLGQLVATPGALKEFSQEFLQASLQRHVSGDWGDLDADDKAANDNALKSGEERIFSAYKAPNGVKAWIITEWDRSVTTILRPEDY
jgi:hypothetical protein